MALQKEDNSSTSECKAEKTNEMPENKWEKVITRLTKSINKQIDQKKNYIQYGLKIFAKRF